MQPAKENALKFEMFIFDVLPLAERWTVVETPRREEFEPLKNATGADSPETVRQAMSNLAADWLEKAGVQVPRQADGNAAVPLEISPLYALDAGGTAYQGRSRPNDIKPYLPPLIPRSQAPPGNEAIYAFPDDSVNSGKRTNSPPFSADGWAQMPTQVQLALP